MNKDEKNKKKPSDLTDTNKSNKSDIGNSLENDVVSDKVPEGKTPQARTDNEQDREVKKNK